MVLAPVLQLRPLRARGLRLRHEEAMEQNAKALASKLDQCGRLELIGAEGGAAAAGRLQAAAAGKEYDEFDVSWPLSAERGWMLPAYTMPPNAGSREGAAGAGRAGRSAGGQIDRLASDIEEACGDAREEGRRPQVRAPQDGNAAPATRALQRAIWPRRAGRLRRRGGARAGPATRRARRAGR